MTPATMAPSITARLLQPWSNLVIVLQHPFDSLRSREGRPFSNAGYIYAMSKVMISLPDELLARVDARATEQRSSRSATLRELAEAALSERQRQLGAQMAELESGATGHGGAVDAVIKAERPT